LKTHKKEELGKKWMIFVDDFSNSVPQFISAHNNAEEKCICQVMREEGTVKS
jgi:hypothetical protein